MIIDAVRPEADHGRRDQVLMIMRLGAYMPNEIWAIGDKLKKSGEVLTHLITFNSIFVPSRGRQSPKSSEWIARAIDRISQNFPGIGEKWSAKLSVEIRKNLNVIGN